MTLIGTLRMVPTAPMSRAVALAIVLLLASACLADVTHAVVGEPDGCAQAKLEGQRSPGSFVDTAVLPSRFQPGEPVMLTRIVHADTSITASPVFATRAAPRAPPIA